MVAMIIIDGGALPYSRYGLWIGGLDFRVNRSVPSQPAMGISHYELHREEL